MKTAFQPSAFQTNAFQILTPINESSGRSIVLPVVINFYNWACSLLIDFSQQEIPIPPRDEAKWKEWAQRVYARNIFSNDNIPNPSLFSDWRTWAMRVCQAING